MKFATTILFFVICLFPDVAFPQYVASVKKSSFKIGAGYAQMGGFKGFQYFNEYNYKLSSAFIVAPAAHFSMASSPADEVFFTQNALFGTDVNIYFTPLPLLNKAGIIHWRNQNLQIGGGAGIRYFTQSQFTGSSIVGSDPDQFAFYKKKRWTPGINITAAYEWTFADKWLAGVKVCIQTYDGGEAVTVLGLNTGMKF